MTQHAFVARCKSHRKPYTVRSLQATHALAWQVAPSRDLQPFHDTISANFMAIMPPKRNIANQRRRAAKVGWSMMQFALFVRIAIFASLLPALSISLHAQSLQEFGYLRMTVNHKPALGVRPLAVVLQNYAGHPALLHSASYYDNLIYGFGAKNIHDYYSENSHDRFTWGRAGSGVYGPFQYAANQFDLSTSGKLSLSRLGRAVQALANDGFDFTLYDTNGDGVVTRDELSVLVIDNLSGTSGGNRSPDPACLRYTNPARKSVNICLDQIANVGDWASFSTIAHELSHQLGTIEMYGTSGNENFQYTLMGATMYPNPDDVHTFHLDPWHKMMLGWVEPRIYSLDSDGNAVLDAAQLPRADSPIILYSPSHGPLEFYMLEFRSGSLNNGTTYDASLNRSLWSDPPQAGLVIWHIKTKGLGGENVNADVEILDAYDFGVYHWCTKLPAR
jgi:M6 family metalloprotease-like protein